MVADAIELGFPIELFKRGVVILVCFDMGVEKGEGQVVVIDKDVFEDVRVLASRWNTVGRDVRDTFQCTNAVRHNLRRAF